MILYKFGNTESELLFINFLNEHLILTDLFIDPSISALPKILNIKKIETRSFLNNDNIMKYFSQIITLRELEVIYIKNFEELRDIFLIIN